MAEHNQLYQQALYYDVVFDRDVTREADFIQAVYRRWAGAELTSVIELACGPGYHARTLARRGLRAVGLDLRPEMIDFARERAGADRVQVSWLAADMRQFQLEQPVDMALCMLNSLDALTTNDDWLRHFRAVSNNLRPRGLYLIELDHPRDCALQHYGQHRYAGEREGLAVEFLWPSAPPRWDVVQEVARIQVQMKVKDHGREIVFDDQASERMPTPQDINLLALLSGAFRVVGWYGDFDLNQPLDDTAQSRRVIAVLQKVELSPHYLSPKLEVRVSPRTSGLGLFARQALEQDEVALVCGGEIVTAGQLPALEHDPHRYTLQIEEDLYLTSVGGPADYYNHSCDPNLGMRGQITLVARRPIAAGEEVTIDYAMSDGSPYDEFECHCGAVPCRGRVTGDDWRRPELWNKYAGYFSPYLQRRIDQLRNAGR